MPKGQTSRDLFNHYIYIKDHPRWEKVLNSLHKDIPKVSFSNLGRAPESEIHGLSQNLIKEKRALIRQGVYYQISHGPLVKLIVRACDLPDEEGLVPCKFHLLDRPVFIAVPVNDIHPVDFEVQREQVPPPKKKKTTAIIVDGNEELYRLSRHYDSLRADNGQFVGGAMGVYFLLLRLKFLHPTSDIHLVFGYDVTKYVLGRGEEESVPPLLRENRDWLREFSLSAGFYYYDIEGSSGRNTLENLTRGLQGEYRELLIVSSRGLHFQASSFPKTKTYKPKIYYRSHPTTTSKDLILRESGFSTWSQLNWYSAIYSNSEGLISLKAFNYARGNHYLVSYPGLKESVTKIRTLPQVEELLAKGKGSNDFLRSGQFHRNLGKLTHVQTLHIRPEEHKGSFYPDNLEALLRKFRFIRELEVASKTFRIFQGTW